MSAKTQRAITHIPNKKEVDDFASLSVTQGCPVQVQRTLALVHKIVFYADHPPEKKTADLGCITFRTPASTGSRHSKGQTTSQNALSDYRKLSNGLFSMVALIYSFKFFLRSFIYLPCHVFEET